MYKRQPWCPHSARALSQQRARWYSSPPRRHARARGTGRGEGPARWALRPRPRTPSSFSRSFAVCGTAPTSTGRAPPCRRGLRVPGRGVARDRGGRRCVVPRCALLCAARAARGAWRGRAARGAGLCLLAECPSQQTWGTPACVRAGRAHATNAATHGAGARQVHASRGRGGPRAASRAWRGLAEEGRSRPPDDQAKGRLLP